MDRSEWNPTYQKLWDYCAAKPDAVEDHPWGETVFKVKGKIFAFLGHPGSTGVTVKSPPEQLTFLLGLPFVRRSAYIGRYGWVSISIADRDALDLALPLIDWTYDQIVGKKRSPSQKRSSQPSPSKKKGPGQKKSSAEE